MSLDQTWGLRNVLGPVLTRLIIYGTNPVDVEQVMRAVEDAPMRNALDLENNWSNNWINRAEHYLSIAENASTDITKEKMYRLVTQCYYATFLINYAEHSRKCELYKKYSEYYHKTISFNRAIVEKLYLPLNDSQTLPAYLHLPEGKGQFPCTVVLAGLGSCKEEMEIFVRPILERGIAALVPDLPGCGESIYNQNIKCRRTTLEQSFDLLFDFIDKHELIDSKKIGTAGLCMGGGLSFMAASREKRISFTATLFPLIINQVADSMVPEWMKSGKWFELISGMTDSKEFLYEMGLSGEEEVNNSFLMIHSKHDNWMTLEMAKKAMFDKVTGEKEIIIVEEEPVLTSKEAITHSMPVGEQMHWAKEVLADWIYKRVNN